MLPDDDGDTVCNLIDICPDDQDPGQEDGDNDGPGDACDPCTNGVGVTKPKIKITKYTTGPGDDTFSFSGTLDFASAPTLDPAGQEVGVRFIVEDATAALLFDVDVPGGTYNPVTRTGWIANGSGTSHTFRTPTTTPVEGVVTKVKLSTTNARPDLVEVHRLRQQGRLRRRRACPAALGDHGDRRADRGDRPLRRGRLPWPTAGAGLQLQRERQHAQLQVDRAGPPSPPGS